MPERCASRCSTVTSSPMSGRSEPSTERAVVESSSEPSSTRVATVTAVKLFAPLASANRVSTVFGISYPRCANPYAFASSTSPSRSMRTTPEKPFASASSSTAGATSATAR